VFFYYTYTFDAVSTLLIYIHKAWKRELERVTAEKLLLYEDYYRLRDEAKNMEALRSGAERVLQVKMEERDPRQRSHDIDL